MHTFICSLFVVGVLALNSFAPAAPTESTGDASDDTRDVLRVELKQQGATLHATVTCAGDHDFATMLIMLNTDGDARTGFSPTGRPDGGIDILVQGGGVHRFAGSDPAAWQWEKVADAPTTLNGAAAQVAIPTEPLGTGAKQLGVWIMANDWQDVIDIAPDKGFYTVNIKPAAATQSAAAEPAPPAAPQADQPLPKHHNAALPARERTAEAQSFYCYYAAGDGDDLAALAQHDVLILEQANMPRHRLDRLKAAGCVVTGYMTLGEAHHKVVGNGQGPGGYASYYFDTDNDGQPDQNPFWKSYHVDPRDPAWVDLTLERMRQLIEDHGYDGVFLDTIEKSGKFAEGQPGMVALIKQMREAFPDSVIVFNQGIRFFDQIAPYGDAIVLESFTLGYDMDANEYHVNSHAGMDYTRGLAEAFILPVIEQHPMPVMSIEYVPRAGMTELMQLALDRAATFGFLTCFAPLWLDDVYLADGLTGEPDPKYRGKLATPENLRTTLDESRNGLPAGTVITPSGTFQGYDIATVVDGIDDRSALHWSKAAWASDESVEAKWFTIELPEPRQGGTLVIDWAFDNGMHYPSRRFRVEVRRGDGDWKAVDERADNTQTTTRHGLPDQAFDAVRVFQPIRGGHAQREHLMWVEQVDLQR